MVDWVSSLMAQVKTMTKNDSSNAQLQELGYETSMVFVNTTLETALERNRKRDRSVPPRDCKARVERCTEELTKISEILS